MKEMRLADARWRCEIISTYLFHKEFREKIYDKLVAEKVFVDFMCVKVEGGFLSYKMVCEKSSFHYAVREIDPEFTIDDVFHVIDLEADYRRKLSVASNLVDIADQIHNLPSDEVNKKLSGLSVIRSKLRTMLGKDTYEKRKTLSAGLLTGVKSLDDLIYGLEFGTVSTVFGFVGHGKTMFLVNLAYNAICLGYSSLFITLEVPKEFIHFQFLSRHSFNPKFTGKGEPVSTRDIRKGSLTPEQEKFLFDIVEPDFKELLGKLYVVEPYEMGGFDHVSLRSFINTLPVKIDAIFLDYIQLLMAGGKYELGNYYVREFTKLALGEGKDRKVVVLASQSNREGFKKAVQEGGVYDITAISELAQIERDSSYIISLFLDDSLRSSGEIKIQLLKHRGGEIKDEPFIVHFDPRYSAIGDNIEGFGSPVSSKDAMELFSEGLF